MSKVHQFTYYCAKTNRPFTVDFVRKNADEKYRIKKIEKSDAPCSPFHYVNLYDDEEVIFSADVDFTGFNCPHCNVDAQYYYIICSRCNRHVCLGGSTRDIWNCLSDCGNSFPIDSLTRGSSSRMTTTILPEQLALTHDPKKFLGHRAPEAGQKPPGQEGGSRNLARKPSESHFPVKRS